MTTTVAVAAAAACKIYELKRSSFFIPTVLLNYDFQFTLDKLFFP
jgi:hypothetical protein